MTTEALRDTWRDDVDAVDLHLVPGWRSFPIESYTAILATGRAAASKKRYTSRAEATREATAVATLIRYYMAAHPSIAPDDFGYRVWESAEDGLYRWAILPQHREHRLRKPQRPRALGRPA